MAIHQLSIDEARQIAVRAAGLDAHRPDTVLDLVRQIAMLRVELTPTVTPAADHVAWSRLGSSYTPADTQQAVTDGELFERGWMLRPMSDLPLYRASMRTWATRAQAGGWLASNAAFARSILSRIAADGPLTSRDIPDDAVVPWPSTGWKNNRNVTQMLEILDMTGKLTTVGREGRLRLWDLAERVFPDQGDPGAEEVPLEEAIRIRSKRLLGACGIMRDSIAVSPTELHSVAPAGELATIEGVAGKWRVDPAQLGRGVKGRGVKGRGVKGRRFVGRTVILSPFDRLMTDPQRVGRLFEFDYALEMYKPEQQRMWGQFALPILHHDRLVGKVDAKSDHASGRFVVHRIHEDEPFDLETRHAVDEQLDEFAGWLGLEVVRV
jgi:uncharacterized protein YcaQ